MKSEVEDKEWRSHEETLYVSRNSNFNDHW